MVKTLKSEMNTERKFFEAFDIPEKPNESGYGTCLKFDYAYKCKSEKRDLMNGCTSCEHFEVMKCYPLITNDILLDLICELSNLNNSLQIPAVDRTNLKIEIMNEAVRFSGDKDFYNSVRSLFGYAERKNRC